MKEIVFIPKSKKILSFDEEHFKEKYEERVGNNSAYNQVINGEAKHLAVCSLCGNPVVILGIYKKIDNAPHARHFKGVCIPNVVDFDEESYNKCPYHRSRVDYVKEYVPAEEEEQRLELYGVARENYDKVLYLLSKTVGIYISIDMAEKLAVNYGRERAYNYIDATIYNIPWYLIYCFSGFKLQSMIIRKGTTIYKHLKELGFALKESRIKHYVYVADGEEYLLLSTNYKSISDEDENINEWLEFSIVQQDEDVECTELYQPVDHFSVKVSSSYFGNLLNYKEWKTNERLIGIANKYMK